MKNNAVLSPNLGIYQNKPAIALDPRAIQDGMNFRCKNGQLTNLNLGWNRLDAPAGNDANTIVLIHANGTDATTYLEDTNAGGSSHYWTPAGNAQLDTAQSKFGGGSILFDGTGDWYTTPDLAEFDLASAVFTIDLQSKVNVDGTQLYLAGQLDAAGEANANSAWFIKRTAGNKVQAGVVQGVVVTTVTSTSNFTTGAFMHIEFLRTGNILRLYINGAQEGGDIAFTGAVNNSSAVYGIGVAGAFVTNPFNGWIDEYRHSNIVRHTANFTPSTVAYRPGIALNGAVRLIANLVLRTGSEKLVFGTLTDLYQYDEPNHEVRFITPVYVTGTAAVAGSTVTGVGTDWDPNARIGDEIAFGSAAITDPNAAWFPITNVGNDTTLTISPTSGTVAAGPYTIRRKFTGDFKNIWQAEIFVNAQPSNEDQLWMTNGIDNIVSWSGLTTAVVEQSALGFKAKLLKVYSNMMIFGNLIQGGVNKPTDIINSDAAKPAVTIGGLANQFKVHGGFDALVKLQPIGDSLVAYSGLTLTMIQFIGDPLIFTFRHAVTSIGPIGTNAVADFGDYHEFIGKDSQYSFDGATAKEVGEQLFRNVIREQDPVRAKQTYSFFDDEQGDLVWVVPSTVDTNAGQDNASPSRAIGEHYLEDVGERNGAPLSRRTFPFTAQGYFTRNSGTTWDTLTQSWSTYNFRWNDQFFFSAFPLILVGDINGKIYTLNTSQDGDGGVALPSYVRFGRRAVQDGTTRGLVTRVYPYVTQFTTPLDVTVRLADHAQGPITISDNKSLDQTLPEGGHFSVHYRRGRFMELQIGTAGPAMPWELSGYDVETRPGGKR